MEDLFYVVMNMSNNGGVIIKTDVNGNQQWYKIIILVLKILILLSRLMIGYIMTGSFRNSNGDTDVWLADKQIHKEI